MEKQHQDMIVSNQKLQDELTKASVKSIKQAVEIQELGKMLSIVHETEERMMGHIEAAHPGTPNIDSLPLSRSRKINSYRCSRRILLPPPGLGRKNFKFLNLN